VSAAHDDVTTLEDFGLRPGDAERKYDDPLADLAAEIGTVTERQAGGGDRVVEDGGPTAVEDGLDDACDGQEAREIDPLGEYDGPLGGGR
jgi:hypothetical protein